MAGNFNLWVFGDAHVGTDKKRGRESLIDAIRQSESGDAQGASAFDCDVAIDVGDMSGTRYNLSAHSIKEKK